jgi:hypothetical protein
MQEAQHRDDRHRTETTVEPITVEPTVQQPSPPMAQRSPPSKRPKKSTVVDPPPLADDRSTAIKQPNPSTSKGPKAGVPEELTTTVDPAGTMTQVYSWQVARKDVVTAYERCDIGKLRWYLEGCLPPVKLSAIKAAIEELSSATTR